MFNTASDKYNPEDDEMLSTHPPILWIISFGWFGSGIGLGWLLRDFTNSARIGAASVVIEVAIIATIVSQCSVFTYLTLPLIKKKCTRILAGGTGLERKSIRLRVPPVSRFWGPGMDADANRT